MATLMDRSAVLSADGHYRYRLDRSWAGILAPGEHPPRPITFVMLNPSTADAHADDPTIRRCIGFARREGLEAVTIVNLFAWRATKPKRVAEAHAAGTDIVGPDNAYHLTAGLSTLGPVVFAWGGSVTAIPGSSDVVDAVWARAAALGQTPQALGHTADGHPRHPLFVKAGTPLVDAIPKGTADGST